MCQFNYSCDTDMDIRYAQYITEISFCKIATVSYYNNEHILDCCE